MEEPFAHGCMVAVAHRGDHVPAILAEMLDRLSPCDVPLVRHQDREDEDEGADNQADRSALEPPSLLEGQCGPGHGHATPSRLLIQILSGRNIGR